MYQPKFEFANLLSSMQRMRKSMEDQCTVLFRDNLDLLQRKYLAEVIDAQTSTHQLQLFPVLMRYFFKTKQKMHEFFRVLKVQEKFGKPLAD